jgi:beta-galactosidase
MAAVIQQRLVEFLEHGGRLLLLPCLPSLDEHFQPCTLLADFLEAPVGDKNPAYTARNTILDVANIQGSGFVFEPLPEGVQVVGQDEFSGKIIAWEKALEAGGRVLVAGITWNHAMHEHTRLITRLLEHLGLERAVACSNPYVWTALWRDGQGKSVLYAANLFTQPMATELSSRASMSQAMVSAGQHTLPPFSVVMIDPDNGKEWE